MVSLGGMAHLSKVIPDVFATASAEKLQNHADVGMISCYCKNASQ